MSEDQRIEATEGEQEPELRPRDCFLRIKDTGTGQIEFAADYGLLIGEVLPKDVEDLTEAQYALYQFVRVLQGMSSEAARDELVRQRTEDRPSRLIIPKRGIN